MLNLIPVNGIAWAFVRGGLAKVPVWAWVALALLALWAWERDNYGDRRAEEARIEANQKCAAKEKARQAAQAAKEKELRERARQTDRRVIASREEHRDSVERFIAAGGVRTARTASDKPEGGGAGDAAPVHQETVVDGAERVQTVAVLTDDVRVCTENTILAEEARAFLLDLEG